MATGTTTISRSKIVWPDLDHDGGTLLHTRMTVLETELGDNANSRFNAFSAIAANTIVEIDHNLGVSLDQLKVLIYTGTEPALTRVQDPTGLAADPWGINAKAGSLKTVIEVTTPNDGGTHTFAVVIIHDVSKDSLVPVDQVAVAGNVTLRDKILHMVDTTSARTLTLPSPSARLYIPIKDVSGLAATNNITIATPAAETIDGDASFAMDSDYQTLAIVSDGTNYFVV